MSISIVVFSAAGDSWEDDVDTATPVVMLKDMLYEWWQVPPRFQKLISGDVIMENDDKIRKYCSDDQKELQLTMVVSLDDLEQDLESDDEDRQIGALDALGQFGSKGGGSSIAAVVKCLAAAAEHRAALPSSWKEMTTGGRQYYYNTSTHETRWDPPAKCIDTPHKVLKKGQDVLLQIAQPGDRSAIDAMIIWLKNPDFNFRSVAVFILRQLSEKGDQIVLKEVSSFLLGEGDYQSLDIVGTKGKALELLAQVAESGDRRTISTMVAMLEDPETKMAAVRLLGQFSEQGNELSISALNAALVHEESDEDKELILETLRQLA